MPQSKSSFQTWDFYSGLYPKDRVGLNYHKLLNIIQDIYYSDIELPSDYDNS